VVILKEKPKTKQFWQELSITNKRFSFTLHWRSRK